MRIVGLLLAVGENSEEARLQWIDVDLERKTITLNKPEKHGRPRIFTIKDKLVRMLNRQPKTNEWLWESPNKTARSSSYYRQRKHVAHKLANPKLLKIGLHSFRHFYACKLFHETNNLVLVQQQLGHRSIESTMLYIQLTEKIFQEEDRKKINHYDVIATKDTEEIKNLLEVGFELYMKENGLAFFRRQKRESDH